MGQMKKKPPIAQISQMKRELGGIDGEWQAVYIGRGNLITVHRPLTTLS